VRPGILDEALLAEAAGADRAQVPDEGVELIQINGTGHITGLLILSSSTGRQYHEEAEPIRFR
jgi:hypothetical protein